MELTYYRKGDYLFPNLAVQDEPQTIGKYGMLRRTYLKKNRKNWYQSISAMHFFSSSNIPRDARPPPWK